MLSPSDIIVRPASLTERLAPQPSPEAPAHPEPTPTTMAERFAPGVPKALRAYRDLNLLAVQLLEPDGILATCSCSGHVSEWEFLQTVNAAAVEAGSTVQVIERRGQAADHPVMSSCPESAYLKCLICRVNPQ